MDKMYISLDSKLINKPEVSINRGVKTLSSLPPFYVPQGMYFTLDDETSKMIVELCYNNQSGEPQKSERLGSGVKIELGKNSERIYRVFIPYELLGEITESLKSHPKKLSEIESIFNFQKEKFKKHHSENSFLATKSVLQNYADEIFKPLTSSRA